MSLRGRIANLFDRRTAVPSAPPAAGKGGSEQSPPPAPPSAGLATATLPPFGNQWPLYGARYLPENLATVCACVQAIAGGIGSLPAAVFQTMPDGKRIRRDDHPVSRLIRQPNTLQTWPDFIEWLLASTLLQGNGVAVVGHDAAGRPNGLYPIPWWACQPILTPSSDAEAIGSPIVPNSKL